MAVKLHQIKTNQVHNTLVTHTVQMEHCTMYVFTIQNEKLGKLKNKQKLRMRMRSIYRNEKLVLFSSAG